jgi:hypothetical protein
LFLKKTYVFKRFLKKGVQKNNEARLELENIKYIVGREAVS